MNQKYFVVITNYGEGQLANAAALGIPLELRSMAVGDANGTDPQPIFTQTALINETYRAQLNSLSVDENNPEQIIAEVVIPETIGGWFIREIGLYDAAGYLFAVANCPPSYKPQMSEGSGRTQVIRLVLVVSSTDNITLKIDPAVVIATRDYVDQKFKARKIIADTGLTGTGDLSKNITLSVKFGNQAGTATAGNDSRLSNAREWIAETIPQSEAEAGTASTRRAWTAQRVRQAINAWWNIVTSGFGRNFVAATNETAARNILQLTYPATAATVGSGPEVMRAGAFGLGVGFPSVAVSPPTVSGFYSTIDEISDGNYSIPPLSLLIRLPGAAGRYFGCRSDNSNRIFFKDYDKPATYLYHANNLLNIGTTPVSARGALELGNAATYGVGTSAGTLAAGNDSRILNGQLSYDQQIGINQRLIDRSSERFVATVYTNTDARPRVIYISFNSNTSGSTAIREFKVDSVVVCRVNDGSDGIANITVIVPAFSTYELSAKANDVGWTWVEYAA